MRKNEKTKKGKKMEQLKYKRRDELEAEIERLQKLVNEYRIDELTGLPMRKDFEKKFIELWDKADGFHLILADVNGLHQRNEEGGYEAGDALILSALNTLKECNPMGGLENIFRYGGDEFIILLKLNRGYRSEDLHCPSDEFSIATKFSGDFETKRDFFNAANCLLKKRKAEHYKKTGNTRRGQAFISTFEVEA